MPKKAGKYILIAVGTLCVLICAACGVFLYQYYRGAGSEAALTQQVRPASVTPQPPQADKAHRQEAPQQPAPEQEPEEPPQPQPVEIPVDFAQLAQVSPDIYAWLELPDTQVDAPVLQHPGDDLYYNAHNAPKERACECKCHPN